MKRPRSIQIRDCVIRLRWPASAARKSVGLARRRRGWRPSDRWRPTGTRRPSTEPSLHPSGPRAGHPSSGNYNCIYSVLKIEIVFKLLPSTFNLVSIYPLVYKFDIYQYLNINYVLVF